MKLKRIGETKSTGESSFYPTWIIQVTPRLSNERTVTGFNATAGNDDAAFRNAVL